MSHSFCIITNGKKPELLKIVLRSIRAQQIPEFEVIVAGRHREEPGLRYVPATEAADTGRLGEMRNRAVAQARYQNIVMLDDDIVLAPNWYRAFLDYGRDFDILTSQIRLPDGGRYYDHASAGGPRGHRFLDEGEEDDFVYMTGGGGWVMKDVVARRVQWDAERAFYQEEDVDFSRRCQAAGFRISHHHAQVVYHADPSYTTIGRALKRRRDGRSQEWVLGQLAGLSTLALLVRVLKLKSAGLTAEAADLVRLALVEGKGRWLMAPLWQAYQAKLGGALPGTSWSPTGSPDYRQVLELYAKEEP